LKEFEADEVFGPYIRTILEGDEPNEDKSASLEDMLAGLGLEDVQDFKEQVRNSQVFIIGAEESYIGTGI
jgi:hypothetical protein